MAEEQIQIDLVALAKESLRDRQPGEDLDVTLLRVCKDLYGVKGFEAFQTVRNAVEAYSTQRSLTFERALQEISGGQTGSNASGMTTFTRTFSTQKTVTNLDGLPPEMRDQVQKLLESGKTGEMVFSKTIRTPEGLGSLLGLGLRLLLQAHKQPTDVTPPGPTTSPTDTSASTAPKQAASTTQPRISPQPQLRSLPGMVRCENCKLEYSKERVSCPGCGAERKRSLWARLFGN